MRRIMLLTALLLPLPASASEWQYISDSMYADKASIQPLSDGHSRMWMRKGTSGKEMILYEFSCTGQYRILEGTRFEPYADQPKGYSVRIGSIWNIPEAEKNWEYIKPDTTFTDAEKIACKK